MVTELQTALPLSKTAELSSEKPKEAASPQPGAFCGDKQLVLSSDFHSRAAIEHFSLKDALE